MSPLSNPSPGDSVLFKWRGAWVHGTVAGEGDALRLPIRREQGPGLDRAKKRLYWRNRSQLFAPSMSLCHG